MRHISLSTCGVVPGIDALAEEDLQLTLSVSLHAPDSETRSRIMPGTGPGTWRSCLPPATGISVGPGGAYPLNTP